MIKFNIQTASVIQFDETLNLEFKANPESTGNIQSKIMKEDLSLHNPVENVKQFNQTKFRMPKRAKVEEKMTFSNVINASVVRDFRKEIIWISDFAVINALQKKIIDYPNSSSSNIFIGERLFLGDHSKVRQR